MNIKGDKKMVNENMKIKKRVHNNEIDIMKIWNEIKKIHKQLGNKFEILNLYKKR